MDAYDTAVVGGGIIGASAANHLAAAGFSTLLLERGDFAGATSGRSSRLQACGLGYLSPGRSLARFLLNPRFALQSIDHAKRAMRDRSAFIKATPERVRPLTFFVPLYKHDSTPSWKVKLGFNLLERLDPGGVPLNVKYISPGEVNAHPSLVYLRDVDKLYGVLSFTEHQFDWPERICVDTVLHARDAGADARNYVRVDQIERTKGDFWTISAVDLRTNKQLAFKARSIVNAAGAWSDDVARASKLPTPRLIQGAKGTNIVVRLPEEFHGQGFETIMRDGGPFYVIPWDDLHYIGPVDAAVDAEPENFRTKEEEITILLEEINYLFPTLRLSRQSVLYTWSGVRPRNYDPAFQIGGIESLLHDFSKRGLPGYLAYSGGLIMTHRHAGRTIAAALGQTIRPSRTAQQVQYAARPAPSEPDAELPMLAIRQGARQENARCLADLMFRRVKIGWGERLGVDVADQVALDVRDMMDWSTEEAGRQANDYRDFVTHEFKLSR